MYQPSHHSIVDRARPESHEPRTARRRAPHQTVTLILGGLTAGDYLQWVRDPEPRQHRDLTLMSVTAAPLGDRIQLNLISSGDSPNPTAAAEAVGFPIIPEVVAVHGSFREQPGTRQQRRHSALSD